MNETPLTSLKDWPNDQVKRLQNAWITTAEQVVALAATPNGLSTLARQMQLTQAEARKHVESAANALDPATRAELERPANDDRGLGALPPQ